MPKAFFSNAVLQPGVVVADRLGDGVAVVEQHRHQARVFGHGAVVDQQAHTLRQLVGARVHRQQPVHGAAALDRQAHVEAGVEHLAQPHRVVQLAGDQELRLECVHGDPAVL
ncbi:MAG: hypothetical protein K8J09_06545 [Planctomycetes bacterium]|nr:hypothetical protein [Planctomycetota bacterium]